MMNVMYIAAGIASLAGLTLAYAVAARCLHMPVSLRPEDGEWQYDEVDYLWWGEGVY